MNRKTAENNPFENGCSRDFWPKIIRLKMKIPYDR